MTAATPQGNFENFVSKIGEKLNFAIDSVGPDLPILMDFATGMGGVPASHAMTQNVMKFQKTQNFLPHNTSTLGRIKAGEYPGPHARTSAVITAGPTVTGSSANLIEDHMEKEMSIVA